MLVYRSIEWYFVILMQVTCPFVNILDLSTEKIDWEVLKDTYVRVLNLSWSDIEVICE